MIVSALGKGTWTVVLVLGLSALTACSSGAQQDQTDFAEEHTEDLLSDTEVEQASPLDILFGNTASAEERFAETNDVLAGRAEHITECMRAAGFGFYAEPAEVRPLEMFQRVGWTDSVRTNGYGAASTVGERLERAARGSQPSPEHENNATEFYKLSADGQAQFSEAIDACQQDAYLLYPEPGTEDTAPAEVTDEVERVRSEISGNPGFGEIWSEWAACMEAKGYDFRSREDIVRTLGPDVQEINAALTEFASATPTDPPPSLVAMVDALAERETEIRNDDLDCVDNVDLDRRLLSLQYSLEADAVEANGDRWTLMLGASE